MTRKATLIGLLLIIFTGPGAFTADQRDPFGFNREGSSMQGLGKAVEWYGDDEEQYIYLAAGPVLQVYRVEGGEIKELVSEIEFRDYVRKMTLVESTLFIAAAGDGLIALDLATGSGPGSPQRDWAWRPSRANRGGSGASRRVWPSSRRRSCC